MTERLAPPYFPLAGLAVLPAATAAGFLLFPRIHVSEAAADAGAAAWTSLAAIASLAIACWSAPVLRVRVAIGLLAAAALLTVALQRATSLPSVVVVGLCLVAIGWAVGDGIGRRIAHPGHLAPACAVAGGADLMSVLSPEGPSKAIAESETALSVLVVAGPVPGHAGAIAPTIGVGDLVFIALLFGSAVAHRVPMARVAFAVVLGVAASLVLSGALRAAVPALPAIGAAAVALVPAFREIRARDRNATQVGIAVGLGMAAIAVGRSVWSAS